MTSQATFTPRRSCLYMPGANQRALEKARTLDADALILDLEDAVAPEAKEEARANVAAAVEQRGYGHREVIIRINALDSEWGPDDMRMAVSAQPHGILVPKVTRADDILQIHAEMTEVGGAELPDLWVMIETPLAIFNLEAIARASRETRLTGFVMGTNDLAKELRAVPTPDRAAFQVSLSMAILAARAYGLTAIDGVFNDIGDGTGLEAECQQGRTLGFDGKTLIHPSQLEPANRIFSPDPAEVEQAAAVIAAFELPENQGKGVIKVNGRMTELLHLEQARRLVTMHEAIAARTEGSMENS